MTTYKYSLYTNVNDLIGEGNSRRWSTRMDGYREGDALTLSWQDTVEALNLDSAAEKVFTEHNMDDRPTGQVCPSASVGDVIVFEAPDGVVGMAIEDLGFKRVPEPTNVDSRSYREIAKDFA